MAAAPHGSPAHAPSGLTLPLPKLSLALITRDEESRLPRCLASAADLAAELVIVDSGSTDQTPQIAASFGARFIHQDWLGHRDQKNVALAHCTTEWVLALDADEELSPELRQSILNFFAADGDHTRFDGASFNRKVHFLGRWITHGDWYPDRKLRLFRRSLATWGGSPEHDKIVLDGTATRLAGDLHHYSFHDTWHFIEKMNHFGDAYLRRQLEVGARWQLLPTLFRPWWRFFRAYILRAGWRDGFPGFWIAIATAFQTFVRHSRLYEYQCAPPSPRLAQLQSRDPHDSDPATHDPKDQDEDAR